METKENSEVKEKFLDKVWDIVKGHKRYVFVILVLFIFVVK